MPLQPRILKNCMVYMDGDFLLGGHEECELPELSLNTEDYRGGGMDAPVKIDMGMEALECSITFKERRASDLKLFGLTLFGDVPITVRAADESDFLAGQIIVDMRGRITKVEETGGWKAGGETGVKYTMNVHYYRYRRDGEEIYEIDIPGFKRVIGGVDQLLAQRVALGLVI